MFVSSPCSFSRRSTGTRSSSVSPATKRAAPRRIPCLRDEALQPPALGGARGSPRRRTPWSRLTRGRARTTRATPPSSATSSRREVAQRRAHVGPDRHTLRARRPASARRGAGSARPRPAARPAAAAPSAVGSRTTAATSAGNADASAETAPTAPASQPEMDQRLRPDEHVEAVEQVGLERLPRACPRPSGRRSWRASSRSRASTSSAIGYPLVAANS